MNVRNTCAVAVAAGLSVSVTAGDFTRSGNEIMPVGLDPVIVVPGVDYEFAAQLESAERELGMPSRFALANEVAVTPQTHGTWTQNGDGTATWQLAVATTEAKSLNFGFSRYVMPEGGTLRLLNVDGTSDYRDFTAADNDEHGELWTPPVHGAEAIIEVTVPVEAAGQLELELASVNTAYKVFGSRGRGDAEKGDEGGTESGSCNVDVVCPEGDPWRAEIASNGVYTVSGTWFCSGVMVNNTAQDQRPFFLTADHCGVRSSNDQSVVVYWNFKNSTCRTPGSSASGGNGDGSLSDFSPGVIFRAGSSTSDFTLTEIEDPIDPDWELAFSGWDATGDPVPSVVAIHHPRTDEMRISFENDPTTTTAYLSNTVTPNGTHIRVIDWDLGTTEGGSSGSPIYNPQKRIVGQLHGGFASCTSQTSDWYGRVSRSWSLGMSTWLDPLNTGQLTIDTLWPSASGMNVSGGDFNAEGPNGGPVAPAATSYTLSNNNDVPLDFQVTVDQPWVQIAGGSGTIPAGQTADVVVSLTSAVNSFANGNYQATLTFTNLTDGDGNATKTVSVDIGVPVPVYTWDMTTDPGWAREGAWAYGQPTGNVSSWGNPDPTSGNTGPNVLGYNLTGTYTNNMPERHLTTGAIDCSDLTQVSLRFYRWLNVEQPLYDHAYIRVSTNGTTWTTIWENGEEITDNSWQQVEYDISSIADGQPTVFIRWTQGTTDGSWIYTGWNIDDVEILGVEPEPTCPADLTGEGDLNIDDVLAFVDAFATSDPAADFAAPAGVFNIDDVLVYLDAFAAGCP